MKVVLASGNRGKLAELAALLATTELELVSQKELGIAGAKEEGLTFVENAITKARHVCEAAGLPALADDSGLVVPSLGGRPGIRSARYAGEGATDAENNARLLTDLSGHRLPSAHFYCALVYLRYPADPAPLIATASWHGQLVADARGRFGFGYDPHFLVAGLNRTAAELSADEKNRVSHRAQASARLVEMLRQCP
jgi:XTP/dITP diphosphohydrolase